MTISFSFTRSNDQQHQILVQFLLKMKNENTDILKSSANGTIDTPKTDGQEVTFDDQTRQKLVCHNDPPPELDPYTYYILGCL